MAFNAKFANKEIKNGVLTEELYSVEDGSCVGGYSVIHAGANKVLVLASLSAAPEEIEEKRATIRAASDIVGVARGLLRKMYKEYKGEPQRNYTSPIDDLTEGKEDEPSKPTSEQGIESVEFASIS